MENPKENLRAWKLLMSSLFARAMPYLVTGFGIDSWLYTNILPEQVRDRTLTADSCLQFVKFKDRKDQELITEAFPLLKQAAVIINITKVSGEINKFGIEKCSLILENRAVYMKVAGRDDNAQLASLPCCGRLLSQYELNYYLGYFDQYISRKTKGRYITAISPIDKEELKAAKSAVNTVRVRSIKPGSENWTWFRLPLLDGFNFPSMYEYGKKSGVTDYILNAELLWKDKSVEAVVCYDDDKLGVRSVNPRRLWYPIQEQ